jgi:hypothetical protein
VSCGHLRLRSLRVISLLRRTIAGSPSASWPAPVHQITSPADAQCRPRTQHAARRRCHRPQCNSRVRPATLSQHSITQPGFVPKLLPHAAPSRLGSRCGPAQVLKAGHPTGETSGVVARGAYGVAAVSINADATLRLRCASRPASSRTQTVALISPLSIMPAKIMSDVFTASRCRQRRRW